MLMISVVAINGLVSAAIQLYGLYKRMRDEWKASHPGEPDPFLTDAMCIQALREASADTVATVDEIMARHGLK